MIAITNGKIITVTGETLEKGTVLVQDGKIAAVGIDVDVPADAVQIDASGKWVTPGLIEAHNHICAMQEPSTYGTADDGNEVSDPITPQIRIADAIDPRNMAIPIVRAAGFTTVYTMPGSANVIGGQGTAMKLKKAATAEEMIIPGTSMMKMALGENPKRVYGGKGKMPVTRMGVAGILRESLYKAKNYADALQEAQTDPDKKKPEYDAKLAALVPVVRGEMKVRIHCHRSDDIVTAIRISEEFGLKYSIEHVTEGYQIAGYLAQKNPEMVVGPLTMRPAKMEIWNTDMKNPGILEKAGCDRFCLMEDAASATRYLPMHIGFAIARGLSPEMAMKAVTINAARLLGLSDRIGSIEVGKDADLAIWSGDPFSNFTLCEKTMIDGVIYENTNA